MSGTEYTDVISDLKQLAESLALAVANDFMAREHAKAIWMAYVKEKSGLNVVKKQVEKEQ